MVRVCLILQEMCFYFLIVILFFHLTPFCLQSLGNYKEEGCGFSLGSTGEPEAQRQGTVVLSSLVDTLSTTCVWLPLT